MTWGSGRFWAYVGVALGLSASLAANYAHTTVPPSEAPPSWSPRPGAVVLSLCWPVMLFVSAVILVRTEWPRELRWLAVRYFGLLPVAGVAAFVSYRHMSGLLAYYGEDGLTSRVGPLAIDGLMIMATGALLATRRRVPVPNAASSHVEDIDSCDAARAKLTPTSRSTHADRRA
ncbi:MULTISPECIES: DUF2637 domain-containing protein [Salinispora]|uniref:DUF2637 domain-containing protein n=1 Tax=Salinispora TaxID=168694 RepID=UPI00035FC994|nr:MULTISPECIES: DUF2637 domain-containing protein [Salinispora]